MMKFGAATALCGLMCGTAYAQDASQVWHYWGGGAELNAVEAMLAVANEQSPDTPIVGQDFPGSAIELRRQLQTALLGGTPPAAYQSAMGYELKTFADAGQLRDISALWDEFGGNRIFPIGLQRVMKVDGVPYAVPLNMHAISNIFYNKALVDELGIELPSTFEELQAACRTIEAAGKGCLANAGGPFWSLYNFYVPLIAAVGSEGYFQLGSGDLSFDSPEFRTALNTYRDTYAKHYIANWSGKSWPQGADDVVAGRAVFYQMGDWASGYFKDVGLEPVTDYDFFAAPGTGGAVVIQVDAIATPSGTDTSNAAADAFLRAAASPDGQAAFNVHKGSVAANLETPTDIYDAIGVKTYETMMAAEANGAVLPNLFFLLPTELGSELGVQIERFAADPSDATMESVIQTLENLRLSARDQGLFITW
ncbi:ABC transporter substrate-binding protein [Brucella sp. BE17]|uniref:ABC transporter substrate-binding protein n=1 Tax=Brucella sp. BE17 TaxID=3142977 RepID=UPI0031B9B19C